MLTLILWLIHPNINNPGTPVFTHFTSARQRYALVTQTDKNENWIERVTEMDILEKKKKKKKKKKTYG